MEFPHLGSHCSESTCNRLDFLPINCDSCDKVFCSSHFNYERHSCPGAHRKNVQVPVCPLCGEPVPTAPGVEPDLTVGQHIDQQCQSDTKKIFTNRCSYRNCKRKELIPVTCSQCKQNFCLRHRHFADHECRSGGVGGAPRPAGSSNNSGGGHVFAKAHEVDQRALAANAAEYRRFHKPTSLFNANPKPTAVAARAAAQRQANASNPAQIQTIQGDMSEDEALARALALSIMELDESADRNRRDEAAARAVSVGGRDAQPSSSKDKCSLS